MSPRVLWITPEHGELTAMLDALPHVPPEVVVMLRRPHASSRDLIAEGRALQAAGRRVIVNRRVDVALAIGACGVHLPERGLDVEDARELLGADRWVGVSRHDRPGLEAAARAGADYATLSPFAGVPGKGPVLGPARFSELRHGVELPVLALGGITKENAQSAIDAGADGLAVLRGGGDLRELADILARAGESSSIEAEAATDRVILARAVGRDG